MVSKLRSTMCPNCRTHAPLVYRGVRAYCSACGAKRSVLSGTSLTYAGQPAQVGGAMVQAVGWLTLMFGVSFSGVVSLMVWAFASSLPALVTFGVMSSLTLFVFLLLRKGGQKLSESGDQTRDMRREQALFALAMNHGGALSAIQAAAALDMPTQEADDFMTRLAKSRPDVGVEISEQGEIFYTFAHPSAFSERSHPWGAARGVRVGGTSAVPARVAEETRLRNAIDAQFESIEFESIEDKERRKNLR